MPDDLATLEIERAQILRQFLSLGDLRPGSITTTAFHRFQELSEKLVSINQKICQLRPVERERGGWTEQEKKRLLQSMRKWRAK